MSGNSRMRSVPETQTSRTRFTMYPAAVIGKSCIATSCAGVSNFIRSATGPDTSHSSGSGAIGHGLFQRAEIGFHHRLHQLLEPNLWLPTQKLAGLAGVAAQIINLSRTDQFRVDFHVLFPVQPGAGKCSLQKFLNTVGLARGNNEIVGLGLLQHEPHGADVV